MNVFASASEILVFVDFWKFNMATSDWLFRGTQCVRHIRVSDLSYVCCFRNIQSVGHISVSVTFFLMFV